MIRLKPEVITYIQTQSPLGITLSKNKKALYVKIGKMINGKEKTLTKTINMGLEQGMSVAECKEAFETTLATAINVKRQFKAQLDNPNFTSFHKPTAVGVGTMGSVFQMMFLKEWGGCTDKQQDLVKSFYKDLKEYFGDEKRLSTFTEEDIDSFKDFVAKKIAERPKNMTGTVSNNSINKRLGVLRSIMKYALSKRLLSNDQLINPDPRVKNMGVADLPRGVTKRKPAFTEMEQEQFLQIVQKTDDQEWYDTWAWAFDTGMRHEGELDSFTIDNVDFGRKTITFWRPKTKAWSIEMPLTQRCLEILARRRKIASARKDRKVFPSSASSRRSNWQKHIAKCNFNKHFTPYTTRHTFITRLAEAEVSPKVVMEMAGHTCIETTMTYYTKSSSLLLNKAILALQNNRETGKIKPVKAIHDNNDSTDNSSMIGHNSRKALIK
jgi:integrase